MRDGWNLAHCADIDYDGAGRCGVAVDLHSNQKTILVLFIMWPRRDEQGANERSLKNTHVPGHAGQRHAL
jgi:hypothetical protein